MTHRPEHNIILLLTALNLDLKVIAYCLIIKLLNNISELLSVLEVILTT